VVGITSLHSKTDAFFTRMMLSWHGHMPSLCVCVSVCLSQISILSRWLIAVSRQRDCTIAQGL